jgi:hypothetical protein
LKKHDEDLYKELAKPKYIKKEEKFKRTNEESKILRERLKRVPVDKISYEAYKIRIYEKALDLINEAFKKNNKINKTITSNIAKYISEKYYELNILNVTPEKVAAVSTYISSIHRNRELKISQIESCKLFNVTPPTLRKFLGQLNFSEIRINKMFVPNMKSKL